MTRVLVTGGAGFIGSHLVEALVRLGCRVVVLDNLCAGKLENLSGVLDRIEFRAGDIRNPADVMDVTRGVEFVFHLAALASVPRSVAEPLPTNEVNVNGTLNILLAARDNTVRRVIYSASSAAYGDTPVSPKTETLRPAPLSPYAVSKLAGEHYMLAFHESYGLETISLRYFNVFGPRQDPDSPYAAVIPRFIQAFLSGARPVIYGDGRQSRDFVFVEDAVRANLLAMQAPATRGETVNIARGTKTDLLEILAVLAAILGRPAEAVHEPARAGDIRESVAECSLAREILGYEPRVTLEQGLRETVEWFASPGQCRK